MDTDRHLHPRQTPVTAQLNQPRHDPLSAPRPPAAAIHRCPAPLGPFLVTVNDEPLTSPRPRSRHRADHPVTMTTNRRKHVVKINDAVIVILSDGQHSTDFFRFFHRLYPGSEHNFGGAALAFVRSRRLISALLLAMCESDVSAGSERSVAVRRILAVSFHRVFPGADMAMDRAGWARSIVRRCF